MTGNNSRVSSIKAHVLDSEIGQVFFVSFKMVGRTNKEKVPLGNGVKARISLFLQSTTGWFLPADLRKNRCYAQQINDVK
jgi:hypothetical protein